jgi:hypothetical protein
MRMATCMKAIGKTTNPTEEGKRLAEEGKRLAEEGKRLGGKYILADGDVYEGNWKDDKYHRKGKYTYADGRNNERDIPIGGRFFRINCHWGDSSPTGGIV